MAIGFRMGSPGQSARESPADVQTPLESRSSLSPSIPSHDQGSRALLMADANGAANPTAHVSTDWRQVASAPSSSSSSSSAAATSAAAKNDEVVSQPKVSRPVMKRTPPRNVAIPVAFREVNPAAVGLSSFQVANIDQMRSQFNQQVGASNNPSDPQYRERWVNAQIQLDDQLRAFLGTEMFNQYQIHAAQVSH